MKVWEKGSLRQDLHPFEDEDIGKLSGGPGLSHVNPPPDPEVSATVSATPITSSGVLTAPSGDRHHRIPAQITEHELRGVHRRPRRASRRVAG